jgi:hypothetical protein
VIKRILTYLLVAVFCIQLIPIKELGEIIYGNQLIEEICQTAETEGKTSQLNEDFKSGEYDYNKYSLDLLPIAGSLLASKPIEKNYASRLADDKPTRPPLEFLRY